MGNTRELSELKNAEAERNIAVMLKYCLLFTCTATGGAGNILRSHAACGTRTFSSYGLAYSSMVRLTRLDLYKWPVLWKPDEQL